MIDTRFLIILSITLAFIILLLVIFIESKLADIRFLKEENQNLKYKLDNQRELVSLLKDRSVYYETLYKIVTSTEK